MSPLPTPLSSYNHENEGHFPVISQIRSSTGSRSCLRKSIHDMPLRKSEAVVVLATWDIRSNKCALTMSFTHIYSSFSHITGKLFHCSLPSYFRMDIPSGMPLRGREENESVFFVHYPLPRATFEGSSQYRASGGWEQ